MFHKLRICAVRHFVCVGVAVLLCMRALKFRAKMVFLLLFCEYHAIKCILYNTRKGDITMGNSNVEADIVYISSVNTDTISGPPSCMN
jgi:hypothetical protein